MILCRFWGIGIALLGLFLGSASFAGQHHFKESHAMRSEDSRPPLFTLPDSTGHPVALHDFLGSHRIILLFVPASEEATGIRFLQHVQEQRDRFRERDLVVLTIVSSPHIFAAHAYEKPIVLLHDPDNRIADLYGAASQISFYVIGKDGGIKMARHDYPTNQELFGLIDTMPMRRQEMRSRSHSGG